jgi:lysozyme family protein
METNFEKAFEFAMEWEKWRSDDPNDPGGLTIWGVTWRYHPNEVTRMKEMSKEDSLAHAKEFYHREYWVKQGCDKIANPLDIVVFDSSIVPGRTAANTFLMMTHDWRDYLFLRLAHFASSPVAGHYMRGWTNRVVALWRMVKDL